MARKRKLPRWDNITRLVLVKFLTALYFYAPYMTLFFHKRGFSYLQINSMWGIVVFTIFLAEIPTGILADRWGRRRAVQAAILLQFLGEVLFLFIQAYWLLVLDAIIAGIGFAFGSGALEALVYDELLAEKRPKDMQRVMGRLNGAGHLGFIVAFAASGWMVPQANQANFQTAILATAFAVGLGFLVTLTLQPARTPRADSFSPPPALTLLKDGLSLLKAKKTLRRLILLSILTIAFWDTLSSLYQPYFQKIGVPESLFGPTLSLASLLAFLASRNAHRIEKTFGPRWTVLITTLTPGLIYLVLFINRLPVVGMLALALFRGFEALKAPLFADYHNQYIHSQNRATVLSMISMLAGGYTAVMGLVMGAVADRWLMGAFLIPGVLICTFSLLLRINPTVLRRPQNKDN
jgi:MFS family permease